MTDLPKQLTEGDLERMSPEEIVDAYDRGTCDQMLGVEPDDTALVYKAQHGEITYADVQHLATIGRHDLINDAHREGRIAADVSQ